MWFKNLSVFRLTETLALSPEQLAEQLQTMAFKPCAPHQDISFGWTVPTGPAGHPLVHSCQGLMMICGKKEEKVLPTAVVDELAQERIADTEQQQGRKLSKKERAAVKEELVFELLPRAFAFSRKTYAYLDVNGGWLVVDTASTKAAEDLLSQLRKCLGGLPVAPLNTHDNPVLTMTAWLASGATPEGLAIEDECELRSPDDGGGIVRCKRHDLAMPEIKNHLDNGKQVIKLALNWADRASFILDEHLAIKRLRFLNLVQEQAADVEADSEVERFDADFAIMGLELAELLPKLLGWFGGEQRS